ncbi:terminase large subunit [Luteolibacter sp. GHJ8]|uniref:Terminase large subunit n=1 Tax=Luteolibacter rhizosphaerae TaxID=2989719 RepID=A0ABT3GAS3_9BACT|nr:terminase TerL endonuclease subunit [Luteolibacter rhizosphaerae]MCW1916606.1 terminase large subunit [Luteolibacter rhizosphaerae]
MPPVEHVAETYAREVTGGARLACQWVRLACERFLRDLKRKDIRFDVAAADRAIAFIESFRHYKGEWAGQRMKLEAWQKFVIGNIFGWKWSASGLRRFKYAHVEVPRKNGKTLLAAGISLYMLCADGEGGAEVYNAATKKDQAMILHKDARVLIEKSKDPDFKAAFSIRKNPPIIEYEAADSYMRPLGRDTEGDTTDGLNPHAIIADETHAWATEGFWNVLNSALGARSQPLFLMITTAGYRLSGVGRQHSLIVQRILRQEDGGEGDDYFGIIYTIDEGDNIEEPLTWAKANPLYGITVNEKKFRSQIALAKANPAINRELKTKWLNLWINQASLWLDSDKWLHCKLEFDKEQLAGKRCYGGLDLAITRDLSALVWVFPPQEGIERWTFLPYFWCPAEDIVTRSKRDKVPYQTWAEKGFIIPTPGEVMDQGYIHRQILEDCGRYDVQAVGYDKTYAASLINPLVEQGVNMMSFSQGIMTISPYAKELERLVIEGTNLNHFGHPVLAWNAGNVVVHMDANGNIKPDKKNSEDRIDGIIAAIMGLGVAIETEYGGSLAGDWGCTVL